MYLEHKKSRQRSTVMKLSTFPFNIHISAPGGFISTTYKSSKSFNSFVPERPGCHFETAVFHLALRWMPRDRTDDKSILIQVMTWCRQATSHYLSQCWPSSVSPYGDTRPKWGKWFYASRVFYLMIVLCLHRRYPWFMWSLWVKMQWTDFIITKYRFPCNMYSGILDLGWFHAAFISIRWVWYISRESYI